MGKPSRDKGNRRERQIVHMLRAAGIPARRVPLSGATEYAKGDVEFSLYKLSPYDEMHEPFTPEPEDRIFRAEVKARRKFPAWLQEYLGDMDCLFLVEDRQGPLVVMRIGKFTELIG